MLIRWFKWLLDGARVIEGPLMLNQGSSEGWVIPQRESLCAVAIVGQEMIEPIDVQGVSLLEVREAH
jgi:hypothetical protein